MFRLKNLPNNLIYILGFSATLFSFYLTIFNPLVDSSSKTKFIFLFIFMLINLFIALILSWPKSKINIKISNKVDLNVFYDNILKQKGIIVIPVNEYFDTLVDENIISSNTLHGQFIKSVYGGNVKELDLAMDKQLQNYQEKDIIDRARGKCKKFGLGTTIAVKKDGKEYFLVAFTRFNGSNKAESFNIDYQITIKSLLDFIHINSQGKNVNIPLIGAGQSGINMSKQKLLEYLLFSIQIHDHLTVSGRVNIVLKDDLKNKINLNKIKEIFSNNSD